MCYIGYYKDIPVVILFTATGQGTSFSFSSRLMDNGFLQARSDFNQALLQLIDQHRSLALGIHSAVHSAKCCRLVV